MRPNSKHSGTSRARAVGRLHRLALALVLAAITAGASACTGVNIMNHFRGTANTHPAQEYGYMSTTMARGGMVYHSHTVPGQVGATEGQAAKVGESCSHSVLWLVSWGDSSIESARKKGNITQIESMQHHVLAILAWVYHRHCTIIQGM